MRKSQIVVTAVLLVATAVVASARGKPVVKTNSLSFQRLSSPRRQLILQYLADKTVVLPSGEVIQYRLPQYGFHGGSATRYGSVSGGSVGWYTKRNFPELAKLAERGIHVIASDISQSAGGDLYLIDKYRKAVVIPGNTSLIDGAKLDGWAKEDGIHEYVTNRGAKRRVKKYRMFSTKPLTEQSLMSALQKGSSFLIKGEVKQMTCPKCHGWSREKKTCGTCRQTGKVDKVTIIKITQ